MAMVGDEVRKVICRTCQYSHDYKSGRGAEKKKSKPSAKQSAFDEVLASVLAGRSMEAPVKVERPSRPARSLAQHRPPARTQSRPSRSR
jgi:hypothetical protein